MSHRRHHNNKGLRQIRVGKTRLQVRDIANRVGIPYKPDDATVAQGRERRVPNPTVAGSNPAGGSNNERAQE